MKANENDTVNEWNEGTEPPKWYSDNFWQTISVDPDQAPFSDPSLPIIDAKENSAPSAWRNEPSQD